MTASPSRPSRRARPGRRATHSREQIVDAAIAMLDREGIKGLTLRGLAAELGGGLGSIYWYVEGKAELVDLACEELLGRALTAAHSEVPDAVPSPPMEVDLETTDPQVLEAAATLRRTALAFYAEMDRHPWLAAQTQLRGGESMNSLRLWEQLGRPLAAMGLTRRQQFHGSTALSGYVVGIAAEMSLQDQMVVHGGSQEEELAAVVDRWQDPAYDDLTWLRSMADTFRTHDDLTQFAAGLDLLVLGIVRQATKA